MLKNQLEFIGLGSDVMRYHTIRTLQSETVGHHSHMVACFCWLLSEGRPSANLMAAALFHDLAEHQLGDIPSPAKKQYGIGEQVNELETRLLTGMGMNVKLDIGEKRILKLADVFQGMWFCSREVALGNLALNAVFHRYKTYAEELVLSGIESEFFELLKGRHDGRE